MTDPTKRSRRKSIKSQRMASQRMKRLLGVRKTPLSSASARACSNNSA